jgi:hypothetical protein
MIVAISQPRYLPAPIYLQRIKLIDKFILLDDVQHSREFENRNYIKTPQGAKWLTINCQKKKSRLKINELKISNMNWIEEHKEIIRRNYSKANYYSEELLEKIYDFTADEDFTQCILLYLKNILKIFEIDTEIIRSSSLGTDSKGAIKLVDICEKVNADIYLSGINGRDYIQDEFKAAGIGVKYHIYEHPVYTQLWGDFLPWMGFIDALFNVGIDKFKLMLNSDFKYED